MTIMKSFLLSVLAPLLIEVSVAQNILHWDCTALPDVCQNMCWGVKCAGRQGGLARLTWDRAGRQTKRDRRTAAGCLPGPNRCSVNANPPYSQPGFNCDEFPFASVQDADAGSQWTRCVPEGQNNIRRGSQGWVLGRFYQSQQGCSSQAPCTFDQHFDQIPGGIAHFCNANPGNVIGECNNNMRGANNEQEYINGNNLAQNPTNWKRQFEPANDFTFRMGSGINITVQSNWTIGANLVTISQRQGSPEDQARWDQIYRDLEGQTEDDLDDFWGADDDWDVSTDTVEELVDVREYGIIIS